MTEETVLYRGLDQTGDYVEYVYVPGKAEESEKEEEDQGPTLRRTVLPVPQESPTSSSLSRTIDFLQGRRVLVINSVTSGLNQSASVYEHVVRPLLTGLGVSHEYVPTRNASTISDTAAALAAGQEEEDYLVIIFGGDTSLSEFVNALPSGSGGDSSSGSGRVRRGRIDLVLVPTGTGNAISASSIGGGKNAIAKTLAALFHSSASEDVAAAATAAAAPTTGTFVPLPNFRVEFPPGSYVASAAAPGADASADTPPRRLEFHAVAVVSWALHAALVADSDLPEYRPLGVARFRKAAELNLARDQRYSGEITLLPSSSSASSATSDQSNSSSSIKLTGDASTHSYVLFTLVSQVEPGYLISPSTHYGGAAADNGSNSARPSLYFVRIPFTLPNNANNAELARLVTLPYQAGAHVTEPNVDYFAVNPSGSDGTGDNGDASHDKDDSYSEGVAGIITATPGESPQRWCVDGQIVVVPDAAGPVVVHGARYGIATVDWDLYILV